MIGFYHTLINTKLYVYLFTILSFEYSKDLVTLNEESNLNFKII